MHVVQNFKSFGYGYEWHTELKEVPGTYGHIEVLWKLTEVPSRRKKAVPVPRVLWLERTSHTEISSTDVNVVHNLHKFRVRVCMSYRTLKVSGTGMHVLRRVIPGKIPRLVYVPLRDIQRYEHKYTNTRVVLGIFPGLVGGNGILVVTAQVNTAKK